MKRPTVNITPAERIARIVLGVVAVAAATLLLTGAGSAFAIALEILLVLAGLDLVVTGAAGHCPLYQKLGHTPALLKARRS